MACFQWSKTSTSPIFLSGCDSFLLITVYTLYDGPSGRVLYKALILKVHSAVHDSYKQWDEADDIYLQRCQGRHGSYPHAFILNACMLDTYVDSIERLVVQLQPPTETSV